MSKRETYLIAVIVLLVGLLLGLALGGAFSGDGDDTVAADDTTSTTSTDPPTTTTTTTAPTTTSTTSTTTTSTTTTSTTTTTTTTTTEPPPPPLADVASGEVIGFGIGSDYDKVLSALTSLLGAPDTDTGWGDTCVLDGGATDTDRVLAWGNFQVLFTRWEGPEVLGGWIYERGSAGNFDTSGPRPDDIVFPTGAEWNQTIQQLADALGAEVMVWEDFAMTVVNGPNGGHYRVTYSTTPDDFFNHVSINPFDLCD